MKNESNNNNDSQKTLIKSLLNALFSYTKKNKEKSKIFLENHMQNIYNILESHYNMLSSDNGLSWSVAFTFGCDGNGMWQLRKMVN